MKHQKPFALLKAEHPIKLFLKLQRQGGNKMMKMRTNFRLFAVMFVFALAAVGCATVEKNTAMDTERLLAASGFQMRLADTPHKLEKIKTMSQRKLIRHQRNGTINYIYADATDCKCLYAGTEKAYKRFKNLSANKLSEDEANARDEDVNMDWEIWGGDPGSAWQYWQ